MGSKNSRYSHLFIEIPDSSSAFPSFVLAVSFILATLYLFYEDGHISATKSDVIFKFVLSAKCN